MSNFVERIFKDSDDSPETGRLPTGYRVRQTSPHRFLVERWKPKTEGGMDYDWCSCARPGGRQYAISAQDAGEWARELAGWSLPSSRQIGLWTKDANRLNRIIGERMVKDEKPFVVQLRDMRFILRLAYYDGTYKGQCRILILENEYGRIPLQPEAHEWIEVLHQAGLTPAEEEER